MGRGHSCMLDSGHAKHLFILPEQVYCRLFRAGKCTLVVRCHQGENRNQRSRRECSLSDKFDVNLQLINSVRFQ